MLDYISKMGWYIFSNKKRYLIIVILLLLANIIDVIPALLIANVIDFINDGTMTQVLMLQIIGIFLVIIVLSYVFSYIWAYLLFEGAIKIENILRSRLMKKFLIFSPTFYEKNKTGDLMAKST